MALQQPAEVAGLMCYTGLRLCSVFDDPTESMLVKVLSRLLLMFCLLMQLASPAHACDHTEGSLDTQTHSCCPQDGAPHSDSDPDHGPCCAKCLTHMQFFGASLPSVSTVGWIRSAWQLPEGERVAPSFAEALFKPPRISVVS